MTGAVEPFEGNEIGSYAGKAIQAYLDKRISVADLKASLGVARAYMYRLIERYRLDGEAGLVSKKVGNSNGSRAVGDRKRIMDLVRE